MGFRQFYDQCKEFLFEAEKLDDILRFMDVKRLKRGERLRKTKNPVQGKKKGLDVIKYYARDPKGSNEEQKGYIAYNDGKIHKMFCTCEDFYFRAYFGLLRDKLASWKFLPREYAIIVKKKYKGKKPEKHTKDEEIRMCKHLAAVAKKYVK